MKLHALTFVLLIIGGLNWLLVGLFGWDIGHIFGGMTAIVSRIIYILVGLSALYEMFSHKSRCKACGTTAPAASQR
ncbi:MAG TPA: DUF378 domain-containing protein [Candidatus Paceibacterota bacterium]|nr:DUF378 domain-containing protein [Candidatus Paceibacterota bacterium]